MKSTRSLTSKRKKPTIQSIRSILAKLATKIKNNNLKIKSLQKDTERLIHGYKELWDDMECLDKKMQYVESKFGSIDKLEIMVGKVVEKRKLTGTMSLGGLDNFPPSSQASAAPCTINRQLEINPSPMLAEQFEQLQIAVQQQEAQVPSIDA